MYAAAAGALVAQAQIDNVASNLANVSTSGFKRTLLQVASQPENPLYRYQTDPGQVGSNRLPGVPAQQYIGDMGSGSEIYATPTNYEQGQITTNGNPLSAALSGPGFFAIRNAQTNQVTYTRNGSFVQAADNTLRTQDGSEVLDTRGQLITLPQDQGQIAIDRQGNVSANGQDQQQIGVYEFNNDQALQPIGTSQYAAPVAAGVHAATNTSVLQFASEQSNSDVIHSIVDLITAQRWFDANEKSISTEDDATNQVISVVGRSG